MVKKYAGQLDGGFMAAEDVVQNAFTKMVQHVKNNPEEEIKDWDKFIGKCCHHAFLDMLSDERNGGVTRKLQPEDVEHLLTYEFEQLSPVACDLRKRLRNKKRPDQDVLVLHFEHGLPLREIVPIVNLPYRTVVNIIVRFKEDILEVYT